MEINNLNKNNEIENTIVNEQTQKNFLESNLGKVINTAFDIGIRALFPEFIDEQIINLKNNLIEHGLKEGIKESIDDAINIGKSTIGIVTGNFENVTQMQEAVKSGGIIDGMSSLIDTVVDKVKDVGLINSNIASTLKNGKSVILNNIEKNIEKNFTNQVESIEYMQKYINNWKEYFNNKDFSGMEKEYKKIQNKLKEIVPLENTVNQAKTIENLHNLIKNNGQNFELNQEELELAEKLK